MVALHHAGTGGVSCGGNTMNSAVRMEHIAPRLASELNCCAFGISLAAPSNLQTSIPGDNQIELTWDDALGDYTVAAT